MAKRHASNLTPRFQAALAIRNAMLPSLVAQGKYSKMPFGGVYDLSIDGLTFTHRVPRCHVLLGVQDVIGLRLDYPRLNLPFGLDIWVAEKMYKVMNLEWDPEGFVELVNFKRGSWEKRGLNLANQQDVLDGQHCLTPLQSNSSTGWKELKM